VAAVAASVEEGDMSVIGRPVVDDALWGTIAAHSDSVDRESRFPGEAVAGLAEHGLLGLGVPADLGGPGGGPGEIVAAVERIASACSSTAMVYVMHAIATQTLLAGSAAGGANRDILREIGAGRHLTTLAFSEHATRSHFWAQASRATADADHVIVAARKSWVTSAGHADSYVTATGAVGGSADPLVTELYLIAADTPGITVGGPFDGLGLCGNASSAIEFAGVRVAAGRRLGGPASGMALMMEATLPWFVLGCAACCVGLAGAAIEMAAAHLQGARIEHLGTPLAGIAVNRARLAEAKIRHLQARALLLQVADQVAAGHPDAQLGVLALKAAAAEMAIAVTDETMRVCGGAAFSRHLPLERLFRDARAATVMAPTSDVLRDLLGRALTGLPLFDA
jgi:alkylation response protein AidB-like acyl-CoA dehydrogenase